MGLDVNFQLRFFRYSGSYIGQFRTGALSLVHKHGSNRYFIKTILRVASWPLAWS